MKGYHVPGATLDSTLDDITTAGRRDKRAPAATTLLLERFMRTNNLPSTRFDSCSCSTDVDVCVCVSLFLTFNFLEDDSVNRQADGREAADRPRESAGDEPHKKHVGTAAMGQTSEVSRNKRTCAHPRPQRAPVGQTCLSNDSSSKQAVCVLQLFFSLCRACSRETW